MSASKVWKSVAGLLSATVLWGCMAESADPTDDALPSEDTAETAEEGLGTSSQALAGFSHNLPRRGSEEEIVETAFLGYGMMYELSLRTGALVDSVSATFYTPSNPNNQYTSGDPRFARGPVGGTAGSAQPKLVCPAGYAAHGLYGQAGKRVDMLGLVCARIASDGRPITSDFKVVGAYGGTGGTFFYDTCGEGKWLAGMFVGVALKTSGSNKIVSYVKGYCGNAG